MESHAGPDRAVLGMRLLVGMIVEQADRSVSFQAALLAEHQQGARSTDLQVVRQQEGDGLAGKRAGHTVSLHVSQPQGPGTKLHTHLDAFHSQLCKGKRVVEQDETVDKSIKRLRLFHFDLITENGRCYIFSFRLS